MALDPPLLPYAQASPAQLARALVTAREALAPYYPALTWPQWHRAFRHLQPLLHLDADQATVTSEGLGELARYFEGPAPPLTSPAPLPPAFAAARPPRGAAVPGPRCRRPRAAA